MVIDEMRERITQVALDRGKEEENEHYNPLSGKCLHRLYCGRHSGRQCYLAGRIGVGNIALSG